MELAGIKESQQILRLKGTISCVFPGKNLHLGSGLTKSLSSVRLPGVVRFRSLVMGKFTNIFGSIFVT